MGVAAVRALDPSVITNLLQENQGSYPFFELVRVIERLGLSESEARDVVWRLLSEGLIRFSSDRSHIQLPPDEPAQKVAG